MGEHRALEDGFEVKYVNIIRRMPGSLHKQNTKTFAAIIPVTVR